MFSRSSGYDVFAMMPAATLVESPSSAASGVVATAADEELKDLRNCRRDTSMSRIIQSASI